jgi:hypothetical protein
MIFHTPNETVATSGPVGYLWMSSGSRLGMFYDVRNSNLGIGSTNPSNRLEVFGGSIVHKNSSTFAGGAFSMGNGNFLTIEAFNSNNTSKLPVTLNAYGGQVGIGTTNPGAPLMIYNANSTGNDPRASHLDCFNPTNTAGQNSIISNRIGGSSAGVVYYSMDVAGFAGFSMGMQASSSRLSFRNAWNFLAGGAEVMSLYGSGYSIGLPKYNGSSTTFQGVGMYTSDGFDAAGTTHPIPLTPNSGAGDNFAGVLYVVGKNPNGSSGKAGLIVVNVIKRAGFNIFVGTPTYASAGMTTWSITTGSTATITVTSDSDVRVAWQYFVGV